jgi:hypothetical protein
MARPRKNPSDESTPAPEKPKASAPAAEPDATAAAAAFARVQPELASLKPEELRPINVDITAAAHVALATATKLQALRDAVVAELPKHPIQSLDNLADYALAAWFANLVFTLAGGGGDPHKQLVEEAGGLRKTLLVSAEPLALKGLIEAEKLKEIRSGSGRGADLANDLVELSHLYREAWPRIKNKTITELEEVDRAGKLGEQLRALAAVRDSGTAKGTPEEIADGRARAFSLLQKVYDENVRAVTYLRWREGDVEAYAPSLFKTPRVRKAKATDDGSTAAPPAVEADEAKGDEPPAI